MTARRLGDFAKGRAFMAPKATGGAFSFVAFGVFVQLRSPGARVTLGERSGLDRPALRFAGWRLFAASTKR